MAQLHEDHLSQLQQLRRRLQYTYNVMKERTYEALTFKAEERTRGRDGRGDVSHQTKCKRQHIRMQWIFKQQSNQPNNNRRSLLLV